MCLKEKVMIINLNIGQWSARKYDKNVSREVEQSHNANDAGRFNKLLIANEALKEIGKISNSARTYHYFNTLPWGDNGDRILPAANYFPYLAEMSKFKNDFENKVSEFIARYPDLKQDAKIRLGTMFNENDYPFTDDVQRKFSFRFSFMPVSDATDLRVQINDEEINRIKSDIEETVKTRISFAESEFIERIKETVSHYANTLKEPDKIFRDSLVGNIEQLIEISPLLNFTKNQHICEVTETIKNLVCNPENLRTMPDFRREMSDKAFKIFSFI